MTEYAESLLECDLQEVLGDKPAPDLRDPAIARLREQDRPAPRLPEQAATPRGRRPGWRWIAQAAGIVLVLGLIGWLVTRPGQDNATYVTWPNSTVVATDNGLELSEGAVVLRTGAPELLVLDSRGNTRIRSVQGLAIASTFGRDHIPLPGTDELVGLGLTDEEKNMWSSAFKNAVGTGALTLFVLSGSLMVDGIKVEAGKAPPAGLRPMFQFDPPPQYEPEPEPAPPPEEPIDWTHEWIDEWTESASHIDVHPDPKPGQYWNTKVLSREEVHHYYNRKVVWVRGTTALIETRQHNRRGDGGRYYDMAQAFIVDLTKKENEINVLRAWVGKTGGIGRELRVRQQPPEDWSSQYKVREEPFENMELAGRKWAGRKLVRTGDGWDGTTWKADDAWFDGVLRYQSADKLSSNELVEFGTGAKSELTINENAQTNADTPKPDDIPGIRAFIGKAVRAELRTMDDDHRWRGWLQAKAVNDVEAIRVAFADNLKAKAVKIAGYDHLNTFRLELADGRVLRAAVYTYGDLVDLSMPGQVGSTQYEVDPALRKALQPWLDKAAKVDPLPLKDAAAMRELLARAQSVVFRDDFVAEKPLAGTLALRDHVKALTEAFWRDNLAASDAEGGTSRTVFQFTFRLPEDETVAVEITDNGWFAMKIAGAPDLVFRTLPAGALQSIHNVLEPHGKAAAPAPVSVLRSWSGPNSGVKKARAEILTTEDQWKKTWAEHDPAAELPKVDFEREMVLAIFDGDSWNSRGFYVHELLVGDNAATIIRVDETTYQSMGEGNRVTPFGIFVITRTDRTVTVEENVQGIIGKPPQWKVLTARVPMFRDLPTVDKVFTNYRPAQTWTGAATRTEGLFMTATNDTEWRDMWDKMIIADPQLPVIDWTKQMAVAMRGNIMQGLGDFKLEYAGANANRTVLRLITPTAQTSGGGAESEPRYAIWVIPRPEKSLVVETPRYGRLDQPPSWLEEHVVKLK